MKTYDWLVVGGGFQGIIATALLSKTEKNIAIAERAKNLGGVLRGKDHNGMVLDFGCHLFKNDNSQTTSLIHDILKNNFHPVPVKYAGITGGHRKEDVAVPSFSYLPEEKKQAILNDILQKAIARQKGQNKTFPNFKALLSDHYGEYICEEILPVIDKLWGYDAEILSADSIGKTQMSRIHLLEDEEKILPLKQQNPEFDNVIALPTQGDEMFFYQDAKENYAHKTFYPSRQGMRGFTNASENYFENNDVGLLYEKTITAIKNDSSSGVIVTFEDGEEVRAGKLIWTLDAGLLAKILFQDDAMAGKILPVPMSLFYYFTDSSIEPDYTYIHDFSPDKKIYRVSGPGYYGNQRNEAGQSYICAEVPARKESDLWQNPADYSEAVWQEIQDLKFIQSDKPQESFQLSTPVSYPLMKAGYETVYEKLAQEIETKYPDVINVNLNAYSKNDIVLKILDVMKKKNIGNQNG